MKKLIFIGTINEQGVFQPCGGQDESFLSSTCGELFSSGTDDYEYELARKRLLILVITICSLVLLSTAAIIILHK